MVPALVLALNVLDNKLILSYATKNKRLNGKQSSLVKFKNFWKNYKFSRILSQNLE